jgi:hypothetical protein
MLMMAVCGSDDSKSAVLKRCGANPFASRDIMQMQLCAVTHGCASGGDHARSVVCVGCLSQHLVRILTVPCQVLCCAGAAMCGVVCQEEYLFVCVTSTPATAEEVQEPGVAVCQPAGNSSFMSGRGIFALELGGWPCYWVLYGGSIFGGCVLCA